MNNLPTLLARPDLGKKAYRLRCRFRVEAFPTQRLLEKAKYAAADQFIRDLEKQGFQHCPAHPFHMTGPFNAIDPVALPKPPRRLTGAESLRRVMQGDRLLDSTPIMAWPAPLLRESEKWEFELAGVFIHKTIQTDLPSAEEERRAVIS